MSQKYKNLLSENKYLKKIDKEKDECIKEYKEWEKEYKNQEEKFERMFYIFLIFIIIIITYAYSITIFTIDKNNLLRDLWRDFCDVLTLKLKI